MESTLPFNQRSCRTAITSAALAVALALATPVLAGERLHAITQFGDPPLYPEGFPHWNYVNPDAPKGGRLVLAATGTFDSLNSYIVKGTPAAATSLIYDGLLTSNSDESLLAYYADLAESFEVNEDQTVAIFHMRRDAYFHDGHPITAEDVVFTHDTLAEKGAPRFRDRFYNDIQSVEALDDYTVRITAKSAENKQVALQIATFPIFPAHWWEGKEFDESSLVPMLGSGPYRIANVDPGRSISYERVEDYWARDLPQNIGQNNFDTIEYQYYRDATVIEQAFIGGEIDIMTTVQSQDWVTRFGDPPAIQDGRIQLTLIESDEPENWFGLIMNLRRPQFQDPLVREALVEFYDFETARRTIHYGLFTRTSSYFPNGDMQFEGLPEGRELEILRQVEDRMAGRVRDRIFEEEFQLPETDGSGNIRPNLRRALRLLREAGYEVQDGVMTNTATGQPLSFEILYRSANMERVLLPVRENFERAGIDARMRIVDTSQYVRRIDEFDYDLLLLGLLQFYPPTSALRGLWGSEGVDVIGAENFTGLQDPVVDDLVELVVQADSYTEIQSAAHALDRYLSWLHVSIPFYHDNTYRIAHWDMFGRPETKPRFSVGFPTTWWFDSTNEAALRENR